MKRLLVNDCLTCIPGTRTFWHDLQEWFDAEFIGGTYEKLAGVVEILDRRDGDPRSIGYPPTLIIRNATWFPPIKTQVPTISLLQDIITEGPMREMQEAVLANSTAYIFNSHFTASKYENMIPQSLGQLTRVIPLPVDFTVFEPQNAMGCQQALSLPDGCVLWVGACQGAAGQVKGWDIFVQVVRNNPDIPFVAVLKDGAPESVPPNLRYYVRLTHQELVRVIGACRVGLCTSRTESQHLAGIEMGGVGLPLVVPMTGTYWGRTDMPGHVLGSSDNIAAAVRQCLARHWVPIDIHSYWRAQFDKPVIKAQWEKLIQEIEQQ